MLCVCKQTSYQLSRRAMLEQNETVRLRNVCGGQRKKIHFWKGIGGQTSGPAHLTQHRHALELQFSSVFSQRRSYSLFDCGSEEGGDGNCEVQSFVKECEPALGQAIASQSGWELSSFLEPLICYAVSIFKGG